MLPFLLSVYSSTTSTRTPVSRESARRSISNGRITELRSAVRAMHNCCSFYICRRHKADVHRAQQWEESERDERSEWAAKDRAELYETQPRAGGGEAASIIFLPSELG